MAHSPERPLMNLLADAHRKPPLPERLRPRRLEDFIGQGHVLGPEAPLRTLITRGELTSLLLWGPPGVGKTTLARLLAQHAQAYWVELSAVNSNLADLRAVLSQAQERLATSGQSTVLFLDEIHRYNKAQQDALLPAVENGTLTLVGATTENPSFQVIPALLSRMLLVRLQGLTPEDLRTLIRRGVAALDGARLEPEAEDYLVRYANADGRSVLYLLEAAYRCAPEGPEGRTLSVAHLEQLAQQTRVTYDRDGDAHYDHASAYQKSLRGGDANAAIYWLASMIAGGEDPRFIARRLVITASEDVGNAAPTALVLAMAAAEAVERLGLPEARIPLAQATIYVALAKKSNQAVCAIDAALADLTRHGKRYPVPAHLRDSHYAGAKDYGHGVGYVYSHDAPDVPQQFLPDEMVGVDYLNP